MPGPPLSLRLPTLTRQGPVWLSHGMRRPSPQDLRSRAGVLAIEKPSFAHLARRA
jgi:hypothetical protein